MDVSSHFGKLDLSGEASEDDDGGSSDDGDWLDPSRTTNIQLAERKCRIEALIKANAVKKVPAQEFDEEALPLLSILWHLGVEGATNIGEVLTALEVCDTIRCVDWAKSDYLSEILTTLSLVPDAPTHWIAQS